MKNSSDDCAANGTDRMLVRRYGHPKTVGRPRRPAHRTAGARQGAQLRRHDAQGSCRRKRFISDVQPGEDGGYVITLVTAAGETSTITISDGEDGTSSVIGVKQDSDGVYYWTLNGDFILDNGKNFPYRASPRIQDRNSHWWYPPTTARRGPTADRPRRTRICSSPSPRARTASWFTDAGRRNGADVRAVRVQFGIAFDTASATIRVGETAEIPLR